MRNILIGKKAIVGIVCFVAKFIACPEELSYKEWGI